MSVFVFYLCDHVIAAPVRGTAGDLWADKVLGQTDGGIPNSSFGELKPNQATNRSVFNVGGVLVDRFSNPQRLYLWDGGNSRVLGFSDIRIALTKQGGVLGTDLCLGSDPNAIPMGADIVIGQPDFSHCACNGDGNMQNYPAYTPATASKLCGMLQTQLSPWEGGSYSNMAVDSQGNLYVPDPWNNRVLRYESSSLTPGAMGPAASYVWGQTDFTGIEANRGFSAPNNSTLSFSVLGGAAIDPVGNLWVADTQNNRVLRFPNPNAPNPGVPLSTADLVLGQNSFNTVIPAAATSDLYHLNNPTAIRVDSSGDIFISDGTVNGSTTGRILIYKPQSVIGGIPQYTSGMPASAAITDGVSTPMSLDLDASGNLWVTELLYNQVVMYNVNCSANPPTAVPQKVLLQNQLSTVQGTNATSGDAPDFQYMYPAGTRPQSWFMYGPYGAAVDKDGNVFVCVKSNQHDLWRFPAPIPDIGTLPAGQAHSADVDVFKPSQMCMKNLIGPANLEEGVGVAVAQNMAPQQIIASDDYRLMYWNMSAGGPQVLSNGQSPDGYAGVNASDVFEMGPVSFSRIKADNMTSPQHLYVIAYEPGMTVQVYNLPLTAYAMPVIKVASTLPVLGGGSVSFSVVDGIAPAPDSSFLWISDRTQSRVMRVRNPLTAPIVDIILGQTSYSGIDCNQGGSPSASTLCSPGAIELDHHGNLYVADAALETAGNWRMLRWNAAQIPANPATCVYAIPAAGVFATGGNFNTSQACVPAGSPPIAECGPFEPAFNSDDSIMVAGQNGYTGNRFPVVFRNPGLGDNPIAILNDFSSMSYSAAFDNQDNLYVTDLDRGRMFIYLHPFPAPTSTPLTPAPTATLTATATPGCFQEGRSLPDQSGGFYSPYGVVVDTTRHYIYAVDAGHYRIQVYSYVPGSQPVPAGTFGTQGSGSLQFDLPDGIAVDSAGYVYVDDFNNGRVQKIWFDGVNATLIAILGAPVDNIGHPRGVYADPGGTTVYITSDNGLVYRYDGGGSAYSLTASFGSGLNAPIGVMKIGNIIYVVDNGNNQLVYFVETPGSPPTYSAAAVVDTGAAAGLLNNMFFITIDKAGYIYLTSANDFRLLVFQRMGTGSFYLLYDTIISNTPIGVAVDEQGNIYVSNGGGNKVVEVRGCFTENTNTPTPSITVIPTNTPTPTCTGTGSATSMPTITATVPADTFTCTPTLTPTFTPTPTSTITATAMPPCGDGSDIRTYPNPCMGTDGYFNLNLNLCYVSDVKVKIYTGSFRKIIEETFLGTLAGQNIKVTFAVSGKPTLATGIYYAVITIKPSAGSGYAVKRKVIPIVVMQ
jgi:sugar lactone lactonase YvrE